MICPWICDRCILLATCLENTENWDFPLDWVRMSGSVKVAGLPTKRLRTGSSWGYCYIGYSSHTRIPLPEKSYTTENHGGPSYSIIIPWENSKKWCQPMNKPRKNGYLTGEVPIFSIMLSLFGGYPIIIIWLVVSTILKNMSSSMARIILYIMENKSHVPNQSTSYNQHKLLLIWGWHYNSSNPTSYQIPRISPDPWIN